MTPYLKQHALVAATVLLILRFSASSGTWQAESALRDGEQQVTALEHRWLENEGNPDVLESILAEDFVHVLPLGFVTKREQLDYMRKHPQTRPGNHEFEQLRVRVYGATAIANGIVRTEPGKGQPAQRTIFTDVFVYRDARWAAVNAQELTLDLEKHP
jgi:hypothetical protein